MKTLALTQTRLLKEFLENQNFFEYENFEDCFIIHLRDDQQIFWLGVSFEKFCTNNK